MNSRFSNAILRKKGDGEIPVIPDIKCISPKEGDLLNGRNPIEFAERLKSFGAPVISVVTEPKSFGGSMELLEAIVKKTKLPVLRKDFIIDTDDLKKTKECGADAVLLICAKLSELLLFQLYEEALKIGLEPFVEAHTKEEMLLVKKLGAKLVGINNRNILELEKDNGTVFATSWLARYTPKDAILISESSIRSKEEAKQAINSGADAILVGTAIWQAVNTHDFYKSLCDRNG